ncbi:hypothetical protein GQX73_g8566 [Xylaria multiplex]|uniref:Uncharacterized protein n=1 Tax=Xylaria multiplex TaxID=323545 RepID=A0A7C8IM93_9PEZI|nr:hypothetical protein GQX73_g8566 [Xylaria multiplex]
MVPWSWEVDFGRRKPARTYLLENEAYFRYKYELSGRRDSFIRTVMKDSRGSQRFFCRGDRIESFCGNLSIEALLNVSTGLATQPIALLDDRKADLVDMIKETGICRAQKGPLSPKQLYIELNKPRYSTADTVISNIGTTIDASVPEIEPDAERRLIYITDLNCYTVLALLDTASRRQAYFLRDFICNHLAFAPSIGVTIPFTSFKSFAFVFHFPYYAWRTGPVYFKDDRCMSDGRPLRRGQHLGFLDETPWGVRVTKSEDFIYEAQISCLVAGLDDSSYIGYFFALQDYQVSRDVYLSPDVLGRGERLRRFHDWTGSTVRLVMDLINVLSKTLHACDRFQSRDCEYFQDDNAFQKDTPPPSLCLAAIAKHVEEMKDQLQTLQHLEKVCNNISRELEAYLALEDRNITMIQVRTNESVKAIALLAFLISPPTVTSALYSMQDRVLPWEADTLSWGLTLGSVYSFLGLVLWLLLKRSDKKTDQALQGEVYTPQSSIKANARRISRNKRSWMESIGLYPRLNANNSMPFEIDDELVDVEGTELSNLGPQSQPIDLL